jgi:phospholipid/cholesterol/gamma-HCH transport system substrate-binding protein
VKYSNEIKVGVSLVLAAIIFYVGVRYFQDLPLFKGTVDYYTTFSDAGGLVSGNAVRINGVTVGSVNEVTLPAGTQEARVRFHVDRDITLPYGTTAGIAGFGALGAVRIDLRLGRSDSTYIPGSTIPSNQAGGGIEAVLDTAPQLVGRADSLIAGATATLQAAQTLMESPESDLKQTLAAFQGTARTINTLLREEQIRIASVLENVDTLAGNLNALTGDSLGTTLQHVNQLLARLDRNIAALETSTTALNAILNKIDQGEGTLGLLVNDASLYHQLDSTSATLNRILVDFEQNPKRYLKDLKLIELF